MKKTKYTDTEQSVLAYLMRDMPSDFLLSEDLHDNRLIVYIWNIEEQQYMPVMGERVTQWAVFALLRMIHNDHIPITGDAVLPPELSTAADRVILTSQGQMLKEVTAVLSKRGRTN